MLPRIPLALALLAWNPGAQTSTIDADITRDICIIGGGSSGTYAAIRLKQLGVSVALVEKAPRLGGHVNTFHDPVSDIAFDFGVVIYENTTIVSDYFRSLNVSLAPSSGSTLTSAYANFKTNGRAIANPESLPWNDQIAVGAALAKYAGILSRYSFLSNGYELPKPVPEELLLPWGEFLSSHNLTSLAFTVYQYAQGLGNILAQPTLYVMKDFSLSLVKVLLGDGSAFVSSAKNGNQELYDRALEHLGVDVFLETTATSIYRCNDGVDVELRSSAPSKKTTIHAKKVLVAIEPTLPNIQSLGLDMTDSELELFGQFNNSYYWNAVIKAPSFPPNTSFFNADLAAPFGIPEFPGVYTFNQVSGTTNLVAVYFGSSSYLADDAVKHAMLDELSNIMRANGYGISLYPEFLAFENHSPFKLTVSTEAIRDGFYDELNALQGERNTWWTGAAWQAQDSSEIWDWTEQTLLPRILASL